MKAKRILVITPFFYPHIGGSQVYMENIYTFLIKAHKDVEVDVLCYNTDNTTSFEHYRGLNVYRLPCLNILKGQFSLPDPISLISFLWHKRGSYDLINPSSRFFDSAWWAPVYAKLTGSKSILTDHCATHPAHDNPLIKALAKYIDLTVVNFSLHLFDKVLVTNKAAQDFLNKTFNIKSDVVYGGVDTSIFKPGKKENKRLQVVFVGRMIKTKGAKELFEAAKIIPQADFIFAGPGPLVDEFKANIKAESLKHIKILGSLTTSEVAKLLSESDILVHPSMHHEGFPNVILQAGASKLAVIATDVGGTKEIINEKTGLLIKPNDPKALNEAILLLIKDEKLRERLAQNLLNYTKLNFNWEKISEELYGII